MAYQHVMISIFSENEERPLFLKDSVFDPKSDSICFGCIFPNDPGQEFEESCSNLGIIGPTVGVIGSLMSAEVIKFLTSSGKPIMNKILTYDCLQGEFQEFCVDKVQSCKICSELNKN